jgi:hypothetical protein
MAGDTVAIVPPPVFEAGLACEAFGVRSSNNGGRVESNISQMGSLGFWDSPTIRECCDSGGAYRPLRRSNIVRNAAIVRIITLGGRDRPYWYPTRIRSLAQISKKEVDISAAKEEQVHKSSGQTAPVVSLRQFGRF